MQSLFFQDNQVHSDWSDGTHTLKEIFDYNDTHNRLDLTVTDHVDKNTDWFASYSKELKQLRKKYPAFSIRIGCEVKILDDGTLNTTQKILDMAEVVLGSVHHFEGIKAMSADELCKREFELTKLLAQNKKIDILAHPFSMGVRMHKRDVPYAWVEEVYKLCVKNKIKFEYNHKHAPKSVRALVKKLIVNGDIRHLSFGSDMHTNLHEIGQSGYKIQDTISVLVTGAGAGVGQSILKGLKLSLIPLRIVAVDGNELAAGLYTADTAYLVPKFNGPGYISRVIDICKKEKVRLVFAGTDVELEVLSKNAKKIKAASGATVVVSNTNVVKIADDKWKTVEFLKKHRFPNAYSGLTKDLDIFVKKAKYPLIVKPRVGARSIGLYKVDNEKELVEAVKRTPGAIIQEYLATEEDEYTCSSFFYKGKNYGVMAGQRWLRNGDTYKTNFKHDKKLEDFIAKVGLALKIEGPCNFQLRKTKRGPVIFEINCRFSGTTGAASFLGFNVPNAMIEILCLKRPPSKLNFKESFMLRYWNELFTDEGGMRELAKNKQLPNPQSDKNIF